MRTALLARSRHQIFALLLAVAATACGSRTTPATTPRPVESTPAHSATLLLPQAWRSRVQFDRSDSIVLTLPAGATQVQRMTRHASFTLVVGPSAAVTLRLDSLVMWPAPDPASLPLVGTVWTGRMLGTRIEWQTTVGGGPLIEDLRMDIAGFFPSLPSAGVAAGTHWVDTTTTRGRVDIFETTQRLTMRWVAGNDTTVAGASLLPLRATGELEQTGKGSQAGMGMTMTGQGSCSYTYYLSKNGQVGLVNRKDSVNVLISIPSSHQLVPTVRLIRSRVVFAPLTRDKAP